MVTTKKPGGIGAIGSASARFFHPGQRVREKYPADARARVTDAVITGEGIRTVNRKQQMCYLVTIPDVDVECHIVKHNFRVDVDPAVPFDSEIGEPVLRWPATPREEVIDERTDVNNVVQNVFNGADEIQQLRAEGVEVDDDNEPLPEAAAPA